MGVGLLEACKGAVSCPTAYALAQVFMLFRNVERVNRLWRQSANAERVVSDPSYLVFDEWWGPLSDDLSAVVGREESRGNIRVHHGMLRGMVKQHTGKQCGER